MKTTKVIGVDIGNSSIKSAEFFDDGFDHIQNWSSLNDLNHEYEGAYFVVCTVGESRNEIENTLSNSFVLNHDVPIPIRSEYKSPETLGLDRLAAAVGSHVTFPNDDLLIVDIGSCMTIDFLSGDGVFKGGFISPGPEMRLKAMNHYTNGLPLIDWTRNDNEIDIGKDTVSCMINGVFQGIVNEINGHFTTFNKKHPSLKVVLTGGFAKDFESNLKAPIFASSKIVLTGLHAIWKYNEGK